MKHNKIITISNQTLRDLFSTYQGKSYTILGFTIVIISMFLLFAIYPSISEILISKDKLDQEKAVSATLQQNLQNLEQLRGLYYQYVLTSTNQGTSNLDLIDEVMPYNNATGPLFANIYAMFTKENVQFVSIEFKGKPDNLQALPPSVKVDLSSASLEYPKKSLYVTINGKGNENNIRQLLLDLENYPRPINIYEVDLTSDLNSVNGSALAKPDFNGIYNMQLQGRL